jgi:hypothetical protein
MPLNKNTARNNAPSFDTRAGLGYGTLEPRFHLPKKANNEFPYTSPDNHKDDEAPELDGDDLDQFVSRINQGVHITDFMSKKKTDPFYYAGGNTKFSEAANSLAPNVKQLRQLISAIMKEQEINLEAPTWQR